MPRYELVDDRSSKFWEITLDPDGLSFTTRYGRIGSDGKTTLKEYDSPDKARREHDKLIASKVKKGYELVEEAVPAAPPAQASADGWQRLEFVGGKRGKFWEIRQEGKVVTMRQGRVGSEGKITRKELASPEQAQAEVDKQISAKLEKGYTQPGAAPTAAVTPGAPLPARQAANSELEAAMLQDPDDEEASMVYADWLQTQGDVRGELAVIQQRLQREPGNRSLKKQEARLLEEHTEHFLGQLKDLDDMLEDVEWQMGFIRKAKLKNTYERYNNERPQVPVEEALGWLLDHPSGRFLQDLTMGIVDFEGNDYSSVAQLIGQRRLPTLRSLFLGDFIYEETELNWSTIGNAAPLYKGVPNLRSLTLRSGSMHLGTIDLPELREFTTITGGMEDRATGAICRANWPKLELLSLQFGRQYEGATSDVSKVQPILAAQGLPKLRHLGLTNAEFTDDLCRELPTSRILPQLEELDLKMGTMSDEGVDVLVEHADRFKHLKLLNVDDNFLSDGAHARLQQICENVIFGEQREDEGPDDRYASAIE